MAVKSCTLFQLTSVDERLSEGLAGDGCPNTSEAIGAGYRNGYFFESILTPTLVMPAAKGVADHLIPSLVRQYLPQVRCMAASFGEMCVRKELLAKAAYATSSPCILFDGINYSRQCCTDVGNASEDTCEATSEDTCEATREDTCEATREDTCEATSDRSIYGHARGTDRHLFIMTIRDVLLGKSIHGSTKQNSVFVDTKSGRHQFDVKDQLDVIKSLTPDICVSIAEEVEISTSVGNKRLRRSVNSAHQNLQTVQEDLAKLPKERRRPFVFANIQGGGDLNWRKVALENASHANTDGYCIGGLGHTENIQSRTDVLSCISNELSRLDAKPRYLPLGMGNPFEILHAIWFGVDILECAYPVKCAKEGILLHFETALPADFVWNGSSARENVLRLFCGAGNPKRLFSDFAPSTLNLWDKSFESDLAPVARHPSPVAKFTRAYVHHLLHCGEMLAHVILTLQNMHLCSQLCAESRRQIASKKFDEYIIWFCSTQFGDSAGVTTV